MSIHKTGNINPEADHEAIMEAVEAELWAIGQDLEAISLDYMAKHDMSDTRQLRKSIKSLVKEISEGLRLQFGANTNYAVYVHEGTKPHWPPATPIRQWVHRKINPPAKKLDSITFLVRRKIARYGTEARPFIGVAIRAMREEIPDRIRDAIARAE